MSNQFSQINYRPTKQPINRTTALLKTLKKYPSQNELRQTFGYRLFGTPQNTPWTTGQTFWDTPWTPGLPPGLSPGLLDSDSLPDSLIRLK